MALGPSGFPFEQYIGAIFQWQGYQVKVNQFLEGVCVTHEIDLLAENDLHFLLTECKFHNKQGLFSNVKVPLYIHSRYRDVQERRNKTSPKKTVGMLGGNQYQVFCRCGKIWQLCRPAPAGMELPHPKKFEPSCGRTGLYPVTCLNTLTNKEKE